MMSAEGATTTATATAAPSLPHVLAEAAGVWALLGPQERAAVRVSCRELRQVADQLLDTVMLCVPAAIAPRTPAAAALAAFHQKLNLTTLRVQYHAGEGDQAMLNYLAEYAAATGAGLSAASCSVVIARHSQLSLPAFLALLHALPQLTHLRLAWEGTHNMCLALLTALGRCPQLQSLIFAWPGQYIVPTRDELSALCGLSQLHTLRASYHLAAQHLKQLSGALHRLTCLGVGGLQPDVWVASATYPHIHTLTGPPAVDEQEEDIPWHPEEARLQPPGAVLQVFPCLSSVRRSCLELDEEPITAEMLAKVAEFSQLCTKSGSVLLLIEHSRSAELVQRVMPGSWLGLQRLELLCKPAEPAPIRLARADDGQVAAIAAVLAAAPNLRVVSLMTEGWSVVAIMALLPALRRLDHLHTLSLNYGAQVDAMQSVALLSGLATGIVRSRQGAGGEPVALRRVMLQPGQTAAFEMCNQVLAAQGLLVRAQPW